MARIPYFEWLRALAIIGVINIHIISPTVYLFNSSQFGFWTGNILELLSRSSVPIFFMLSGALLLNKTENLITFFKKRINKVLIPSLFWAVFYSIWSKKDQLDVLSTKMILKNIVVNDVYYHYWFIYTIIGLYLVTPIIRIFVANASRRILEYFLVIWLLATSADLLLFKIFGVHQGLNLQYVGGYLGFFVLGYYLFRYEIPSKIRKVLYLISIPVFIIAAILTYQFTKINGGQIDVFFYEYLNFSTVLFSIVIFLIFKHRSSFKKSKVIDLLSSTSFGIYLIHPVIIELLYSKEFKNIFGFVINYTLFNTLFGIIITNVCVVLISVIVVQIIKRVKVIRNVF